MRNTLSMPEDAFSSPELGQLAAELDVFDSADLLACAGALQLIPANADHTIRLEALAHIAASVQPGDEKPRISLSRLRKICNSAPIGDGYIRFQEDPFNNPFINTLTFYGGGYLVFPGLNDDATFIITQLGKLLRLDAEEYPSPMFAPAARDLMIAVLVLSNEIARRAGLSRGVEPTSSVGSVVIPDSKSLEKLKDAVALSQVDVQQLLRTQNVPVDALVPLTQSLGNVSLTNYQIDSGQLLMQPIVTVDDRLIVAIPGRLLPALQHAIISLAVEHHVNRELAERYCEVVWQSVKEALAYMRYAPQAVTPIPRSNAILFKDGCFLFDRDKVAYTLLVTDPLEGYSSLKSSQSWDLSAINRWIEEHLAIAASHLKEQIEHINAILFIVLVQGIGRHFLVAFNPPETGVTTLTETMTAADIETISMLPDTNALSLWKFASASSEIRKHVKVTAFSVLDEYGFYRQHHYSYYFSDEKRPNMIALPVDVGGELRREVIRLRDIHAVRYHKTDYIVDVISFYGTPNTPIHVPRESVLWRDRVEFVVESIDIPIWVIGEQVPNTFETIHLLRLQKDFVETVAYWLWQFSPSLNAVLLKLAENHACVRIELVFTQDNLQGPHIADGIDDADFPVSTLTNREEASVRLVIGPTIDEFLFGADNSGERQMMQVVLTGLRDLLPEEERAILPAIWIETIIDSYAPLGIKKKLVLLDNVQAPELDERGLPPVSPVQEADTHEVADWLGDRLRNHYKLHVGPINRNKQVETLNWVVAELYGELQELVASLDPEGLLERLVAKHEALTYKLAFDRFIMPTQIACFGIEREIVKNITEDRPKLNMAAVASRTLIEYVVARPPSGSLILSDTLYDRLLAVAAAIIGYGTDSELVHLQLADLEVSILPSGRLGVDRGPYTRAVGSYLSAAASGEIEHATKVFTHRLNSYKQSVDESDIVVDSMDKATSIEFGHTLTELSNLMNEAMRYAYTISPRGACVQFQEFVEELAQRLSWPIAKINSALELLSLSERDDYLLPLSPFNKGDVYPWRFSRSLSYLRRPFLVRKRNGRKEILWGPRHIHNAWRYLVGICFDGRLHVRSKELLKLQSEIANFEGEKFNNQVADFLQTVPALVVRRRVGKIVFNGEKLAPPGDLDVLVADTNKNSILLIECKNLSRSRTPQEIAGELDKLLPGRANKKSIIEHQQERDKWVREHLNQILNWLEVANGRKWSVESRIVVDEELMAPHLGTVPIKIMSFDELRRAYSTRAIK